MTFRRIRIGVSVFAIVFATHLMLAQQTLGSLNGTVVDTTGAAIPGATVTATDSAINVVRTTKTQSTGFYQIFDLPVGTYVVSVEHEGFQTTAITGIFLREAQATTVNATLKVGRRAETVEVTANPMIDATDATVGSTMDSQQIAATPLATGSFTQLAVLTQGANADLLSGMNTNSGLGNQDIDANGQRATSNTMQVNGVDVTNIFNGLTSSGLTSQRYNFNIGAGSTSSSSSAGAGAIGGASLEGASPYGSIGNSLPSPPPETITELRVNTSMYDAQQGATAGAQIDVNTQSGTNSYHGQVYGNFANGAWNADPYFFNQQYQLAQQGIGAFPQALQNPYLNRWTTGASVGGPIKKDKIFFFGSYQYMSSTDQSTGLSQMAVPPSLTDDRSAAGLAAAALSTGKGYTGAIDPIAMALMNAKLPDGSYLIPSAQVASYQYGVSNVTLIGNSVMTSSQANANIDWQVNDKDRLSTKYYYQNDPVTLPYDFSQTGGFPVTEYNGSQVAAIDNTIAINPHFNWEQRLGFFRQSGYSSYQQTLTNPNGPANFGINGSTTIPSSAGSGPFFNGGLPGLLLKGFPSTQLDAPGVKVGPYSSFADMGFYQNRLNPSTNVIFVKGNHTIFAGGGYSYTQLNIENNRNGIEQVETTSFDNFLAGKVKTANVLETIDPSTGKNNANRYYRTNEVDSYVQDKWQIKHNLTLNLGVRYDYHGGMTEKYGNMFNFDPSLYSVTSSTGGATPGAQWTVANAGFIVAGNNKDNPTQGVSPSTLTGRQWGISPRVGFAWSPLRNHSNLVVRGAGGMYYDRGEYFVYLSQPAGSGYGGPFGVTESAPLATYVTGQGKTLEDPIGLAFSPSGSPAYVAPNSNPATINLALQNTLNALTGYPATTSPYYQYGPNCGGVQNQEGYFLCPAVLNFGTYARNNVLPYTINYSLDIQWQPSNDVAIDIGYVGNRGRHAVVPVPLNTPQIATPTNPIWGQTASYGFEVLNQNSMSDGYDYDPIAGEPWNTLDGGNTDLRTPYIGFSPNASYYKTAGVSAYDGLQVHVDKRLSHNYMVGASYTWSHTLDEQSDLGLFFTGGNPDNLHNSYATSDFDRTHVFSTYFEATVPNMAKQHTLAAAFVDGWNLDGTAVLQSGEPYSLYEFYGAVGSIMFGDFPTLMNPILGIKNPSNPKSALTGNLGDIRGTGGSWYPALDPSQISINYLKPGTDGIPVSTGSDPQDIYETDFAPPQRNIFRQSAQNQLNLSLRKQFKIRERFGLQYEFNVFNITNTTSLDVPMNQGQIRQNNACSNSAIAAGNNCFNPQAYYVNYGQIVTSPSPADQQSALANLDQIPYSSGTGRNLNIPNFVPVGTNGCLAANEIPGEGGCLNNATNLGSVSNTIGSNRMVTMGFHFTY